MYVIVREFSFQPVSTLGLGSTTRNLLLPEMGAEAGNNRTGMTRKERREKKTTPKSRCDGGRGFVDLAEHHVIIRSLKNRKPHSVGKSETMIGKSAVSFS